MMRSGEVVGRKFCRLEKEMATHSGILAWEIPWTEEPGGVQSMGLKRVGYDWATNTHQKGEASQQEAQGRVGVRLALGWRRATVSRRYSKPLHTNLQVANSQRYEHASHQHQAWVTLQLALCLLLLTMLQLYHLPPPLPPPVSNSSCLFTWGQPLYANCSTVLLNFSKVL